jgi:hypothetical protein
VDLGLPFDSDKSEERFGKYFKTETLTDLSAA